MYQRAPIVSHLDELAETIRSASAEERLRLQAEFGRQLQQLERDGGTVSPRLRNLHEQLLEEAIEARFDNLPI